MSSIYGLHDYLEKNKKFELGNFVEFSEMFLDFISLPENIQADIVSVNDNRYHFFQMSENAGYAITRPYNSQLMLNLEKFENAWRLIKEDLLCMKDHKNDKNFRYALRQFLYTCQMSVACTLDSRSNTNTARKQNGLYFEQLIREMVNACGVPEEKRTEKIPVPDSEYTMSFEHDIVLLDRKSEKIKAVGQLKTSSKDRLDKVFTDKFMYNHLQPEKDETPFFAIFLNDVQRSKAKSAKTYSQSAYRIARTFSPGHFKAYTIGMNQLDGVYYVDILDSITEDGFLNARIKTIDEFFVSDMWNFSGL